MPREQADQCASQEAVQSLAGDLLEEMSDLRSCAGSGFKFHTGRRTQKQLILGPHINLR